MQEIESYDEFLKTKIVIAKPIAEELASLPISDKISEHSQIMARWLCSTAGVGME